MGSWLAGMLLLLADLPALAARDSRPRCEYPPGHACRGILPPRSCTRLNGSQCGPAAGDRESCQSTARPWLSHRLRLIYSSPNEIFAVSDEVAHHQIVVFLQPWPDIVQERRFERCAVSSREQAANFRVQLLLSDAAAWRLNLLGHRNSCKWCMCRP